MLLKKTCICILSDEKPADQEQKVNKMNDRCLCADPFEVLRAMYTEFLLNFMGLRVVSNEGHVIKLISFHKDKE